MLLLIKFFYFIILMIKLNLKRNDIIVILIIFVIFSIFTYININNTYEKFENNNRELTYVNKQNHKNIIHSFYKSFHKIHLSNLKNIIENDEKMYDKIYDTDNKDDTEWNVFITDINKNIDSIINFNYNNQSDNNNELVVNIESFIDNINKLFKEQNNLFNKHTGTDTCSAYDDMTNHFFNNLDDKKDVIENNNKTTLSLVNINITDIIEQINKIKFTHSIKQELLVNINNYSKLINEYYGDFNINILKQLSDNKSDICSSNTKPISSNSIDTGSNADNNYKYRYNNFKQNINNLVNSSEDIKNKFEYYTIDELFMVEEEVSTHFSSTEKNINLERTFCTNLKKLDKQTNKNTSLFRFKNDLIIQKDNYIKNLTTKIYNIQKSMSDKEINDYNLHRIRTDDQARKQYDAIKQGIENIKNTNKLKINLV